MTIGVPNEVGDLLDIGSLYPLRHLLGELAGGWFLSSFIEYDAEAAFGFFNKSLRDGIGWAILEYFERVVPMSFESLEVFLNTSFSKGKSRFSDNNDAMCHSSGECG